MDFFWGAANLDRWQRKPKRTTFPKSRLKTNIALHLLYQFFTDVQT